MRRLALVVLAATAGAALADGPAIRAGLWELKPTRQLVDGQDRTAQIAAATSQMRQAIANMPPEQRKQMEAMVARQGAGGGLRVCVSPEMAARDRPILDSRSHCEPAKVSRSGNTTTFEFDCSVDGRTTRGKGTSVTNGDVVTTRTDMTISEGGVTHTIHSESQMTYLGADCQGIKPADELAREAAAKRR